MQWDDVVHHINTLDLDADVMYTILQWIEQTNDPSPDRVYCDEGSVSLEWIDGQFVKEVFVEEPAIVEQCEMSPDAEPVLKVLIDYRR